jgi:hypothetical protein
MPDRKPLTISHDLPDLLFRKCRPALTQEQAISAAELVRKHFSPQNAKLLEACKAAWKWLDGFSANPNIGKPLYEALQDAGVEFDLNGRTVD